MFRAKVIRTPQSSVVIFTKPIKSSVLRDNASLSYPTDLYDLHTLVDFLFQFHPSLSYLSSSASVLFPVT